VLVLTKNAKLGQKGSCGVTYSKFTILGPLISRERLKLELSDLRFFVKLEVSIFNRSRNIRCLKIAHVGHVTPT